MKRPKAPAPTAQEVQMRDRQAVELARLDDEENTRVKRLIRGRLGAGSLLGRRSGGRAQRGGGMVTYSGGGGGDSGGYAGAGGYANWSAPN